jgi:hypothetical protein
MCTSTFKIPAACFSLFLRIKNLNFFVIKPTDALISQIYFVMKLYMFRTVPLSIIRTLFTVHSALLYVMQVCRQLSSRTRMELQFHPGSAVNRSVWHIPLLSVQWINSCWWTEELSETRRVSCQNKFVTLVHLVGFITKKFVMMQDGHMNIKIWNLGMIRLRSNEKCYTVSFS